MGGQQSKQERSQLDCLQDSREAMKKRDLKHFQNEGNNNKTLVYIPRREMPKPEKKEDETTVITDSRRRPVIQCCE